MSDFVEVVIDSVRISLTNQQRVVLLRETNRERYLPIWIGPFEAESITIALQEIEIARPQTHDLIMRTVEQLKGSLLHVEIIALKGDVFYGNLAIKTEEEILLIDSRPSDSLALAVRAHVPILVTRAVMDLAGITPDIDLQALSEDDLEHDLSDLEINDSQKRLTIFEDFLHTVDLDNVEDHPSTDEETPPTNED